MYAEEIGTIGGQEGRNMKKENKEVEGMETGKPDWWPKNPYPVSVFPMPEERYPEIVPDPKLRTALSGMLGRRFWDVASEAIWAAMLEAIDDAP